MKSGKNKIAKKMMTNNNKEYVLSLSYGKDSLACLEAIKLLGFPLDRIIHAEIWATDDIQGDLPPMVEFKKNVDKIIQDRYGITVEHTYAKDKDGTKLTYEKQFYKKRFIKQSNETKIYGFPVINYSWCNACLKKSALDKIAKKANVVQYLGIAADEYERIRRHTKEGIIMPLVEIGWGEEFCRKWCEENDLLSPIYTNTTRGGCWFCHNQRVSQLRFLRKNYPEYWKILLKWDEDSPVPFKARTVCAYEKRFELEEKGLVPLNNTFRWGMIYNDERN